MSHILTVEFQIKEEKKKERENREEKRRRNKKREIQGFMSCTIEP
jgi:hypothetical protein